MLEGLSGVGGNPQTKSQKYEIARCVLGAIQVIQHGWEQKNSKKRVQKHLGNKKGMLCDLDLPHSMLEK